MSLHAVRVRDYAAGTVEAVLIDHLGTYLGSTLAADGAAATAVLLSEAQAAGHVPSDVEAADVEWIEDWAAADPGLRDTYERTQARR